MPNAVLLILDDARAIRERAERVRSLANQVTTRDAVENLLHYAAELEQVALEGERRACELAETIARTKALSAEIEKLVAETRARLQQSKARIKPQG
jgi:predicted  nucleic acid-binding Zn-ribbon protein